VRLHERTSPESGVETTAHSNLCSVPSAPGEGSGTVGRFTHDPDPGPKSGNNRGEERWVGGRRAELQGTTSHRYEVTKAHQGGGWCLKTTVAESHGPPATVMHHQGPPLKRKVRLPDRRRTVKEPKPDKTVRLSKAPRARPSISSLFTHWSFSRKRLQMEAEFVDAGK